MNNFFLLLLLASMGCSYRKYQEKQVLAEEAWKRRPVSEAQTHPYFKYLKLKKVKHQDASETWIFRDQTKFQTSAYCDSLGGCMGMPIYNCDYAFSVKDGIIQELKLSGGCPGGSTYKPVE